MGRSFRRRYALARGLIVTCTLAVGCTDVDARAGEKAPARLADEQAVSATSSSEQPSGDTITYQEHIRPLIESNCVGCHKSGGIGPMALDNWSTVKKFAPLIVDSVQAGRMPPWPASTACQQIADSAALPDADRALLAGWERDGFQEGDLSAYQPPARGAHRDLGEPTRILKANAAYTPEPNSDSYQCFYLGALAEDTYLTALEILPGDRSEVHHAQLHRVEPHDVAKIEAMEAAEPGGGYRCGSGVTAEPVGSTPETSAAIRVGSQNLFSYRPGSLAVAFGQGDAVYLKQGSGLVLQIHYNTQFLKAGTGPQPDQSGIAMWTLAPGERPENIVYRTLIATPLNGRGDGTYQSILSSSIPANAENVVGYADIPMSYLSVVSTGYRGAGLISEYIPGEILGMTPHAHAWATRLTSSITPRGGANACLVDVPKWDYGWQFDYMFEQGVAYGPTDVLHVECRFSNTADHQPIVGGAPTPVRTIKFGERTLDEMCVHYLWLRFKYSDFANASLSPWPAPPAPAVPAPSASTAPAPAMPAP